MSCLCTPSILLANSPSSNAALSPNETTLKTLPPKTLTYTVFQTMSHSPSYRLAQLEDSQNSAFSPREPGLPFAAVIITTCTSWMSPLVNVFKPFGAGEVRPRISYIADLLTDAFSWGDDADHRCKHRNQIQSHDCLRIE